MGPSAAGVRSRGGAAFYAAEPTEGRPGGPPRRGARPKDRARGSRSLGGRGRGDGERLGLGSSLSGGGKRVILPGKATAGGLLGGGLPRPKVGRAARSRRRGRTRPTGAANRGARRGRRPAPAHRGPRANIKRDARSVRGPGRRSFNYSFNTLKTESHHSIINE